MDKGIMQSKAAHQGIGSLGRRSTHGSLGFGFLGSGPGKMHGLFSSLYDINENIARVMVSVK